MLQVAEHRADGISALRVSGVIQFQPAFRGLERVGARADAIGFPRVRLWRERLGVLSPAEQVGRIRGPDARGIELALIRPMPANVLPAHLFWEQYHILLVRGKNNAMPLKRYEIARTCKSDRHTPIGYRSIRDVVPILDFRNPRILTAICFIGGGGENRGRGIERECFPVDASRDTQMRHARKHHLPAVVIPTSVWTLQFRVVLGVSAYLQVIRVGVVVQIRDAAGLIGNFLPNTYQQQDFLA